MCMDGRKHVNTSNKSDATSPTVSTESVLITTVIDASEYWDVSIIDAPGDFLSTDMDK